MALPSVTLVGRVGSDPELKFLPDGKPVLNFSVVADKKKKDANDQWVDDKVCWMNAAVFGHDAEHAAETLAKGMEVVITGAIATRNYQRNDGSQGVSVDLTVYSIGPSLRWDAFAKVENGQARPQQQNPWGGQPQGQPQQNPWAQPQGQRPQQGGWNQQPPQGQPAWGGNQGEPPF